MDNLDKVLLQRKDRARAWYRGRSLGAAICVHVVLAAAVFVAPSLFAAKQEIPEFVSVAIVPAADADLVAVAGDDRHR